MTEAEMIRILQRQLELLQSAGFDTAGDRQFFDVGEWLLAFEGVYVGNQRLPGLLDQSEVNALGAYFGEDMSELDEIRPPE